MAYNDQPQIRMRKCAEGVCTLDAEELSPRSGVQHSAPCKSASGGRWICSRRLKSLRQKPVFTRSHEMLCKLKANVMAPPKNQQSVLPHFSFYCMQATCPRSGGSLHPCHLHACAFFLHRLRMFPK